VPWADLGVPEVDAWGHRFLYRVTAAFADDPDPITPTLGTGCPAGTLPPQQATFALCSEGDLDVKDRPEPPPSGSPPQCGGTAIDVAEDIPAVVVSHGKYRFRNPDPITPPSCFEIDNFDVYNPGEFSARGYSQAPGAEFDDLVAWISPYILKGRLIMAGKLP
jgi:hypothetical protein